MNINYIAAHRINKSVNETGATAQLATELLTVDHKSEQLLIGCNELFATSPSLTYASFDMYSGKRFPELFLDFRADSHAAGFLEFSRQATQELCDDISVIPAAKGGWLLFADYSSGDGNYLAVCYLREQGGQRFSFPAGAASPQLLDTSVLDPERLAMACRIDKIRYSNNLGAYLTLTKNSRLRDISEYFVDWLSTDLDSMANKTTYTRAVTEIVDGMPCPVDPATGEIMQPEQLRERVLDYATAAARNAPDKTVNLAEMSREIYGDDEAMTRFADENGYEVPDDFQPDIKILQRRTRVDVYAEGVKLQFPLSLFNKLVRIDGKNPARVIIESDEMANLVRRQLQQQRNEEL